MNLYEKLMKKLDEKLKEKADFRDKNTLRDNIVKKIIQNPSNIGILYPIYKSETNKPIYHKNKIILIPNLTMTDINDAYHMVYIKLGTRYEDHTRGFNQLDKLNSYIKKNRLPAKGYLLMSDQKYNSIDDFINKLYIHTTR
jgi:hypothetical protein